MLITLQTKNHPSSIVFSRNARTRQLKHLNLDLRLLNNLHLPLAHPDRPTGVIAPEHLTLTPAATAVQALRNRQRKHVRNCERDRRRGRRGADAETRFFAHGDGSWKQDSEVGLAGLDQRAGGSGGLRGHC